MSEKNYWVLIPPTVFMNDALPDKAKFLYGRILALADKMGFCYATNSFFAKELKISKETVSRYIQLLKNHGFVKVVIEYQSDKKTIKSRKITPLLTKTSIGIDENINTPIDENIKESIRDMSIRIENNNMQPLAADQTSNSLISGREINELISLFEPVNPNFYKIFPNRTQREALERMVKKHGLEKIRRVIESLPQIVNKPYAPRITTPYQLEQKLGELIIFLNQENQKGGVVDATNL